MDRTVLAVLGQPSARQLESLSPPRRIRTQPLAQRNHKADPVRSPDGIHA